MESSGLMISGMTAATKDEVFTLPSVRAARFHFGPCVPKSSEVGQARERYLSKAGQARLWWHTDSTLQRDQSSGAPRLPFVRGLSWLASRSAGTPPPLRL